MKNLVLDKGQKVKLSQIGHRDFFYPSDKIETLLEDARCEWLPYVGGKPWVAVKIPAKSIYVNAVGDRYLVVWIEHEVYNAA